MTTILSIIIGVVALAIGILVGYILRKSIGEKTIGNAETKARNMILDAENRAETIRKELVLEAKEEAHRQRNEAEKYRKESKKENSTELQAGHPGGCSVFLVRRKMYNMN